MVSEEYIRRLYVEKTMGVISDDDDRWLQEELLQHPESLELWKKLENDLDTNGLRLFTDKIDISKDLATVRTHLSEQSISISKRRRLSYAATAILLLAGGIFFSLYLVNKDKMDAALLVNGGQQKADTNQVQLLVGDQEEVVTLDDGHTILNVAGQQVRKEGEMLIYNKDIAGSKTNTLVVPPTKDYKLVLADGTKVWLNSSSELKFPMTFSGNSREVYLKGEAYFEIAEKADQPFIVHTDKAKVNVLGTKFNLNAYAEDHVITALLQGKVQMESPNGTSLLLSPGLSGRYSKKSGFSQEKFDPLTVLSWKEGVYYFHGTTLLEISEMINRWFDLPVNFENGELKHIRISGLLDKKDLKGFLHDLNTTAGVRAMVIDGTLHFRL
ncbi:MULTISPECIES: FecR family protein [Olivibacter]|jgi:hypothetical protein|uniref:FecR family protein n=1 Tax=Olivibacter oleidegradans TaxID=760123 RepID=A0ABV6HI13_9SPHI|nr:FecR domain-containing protein [Olivibacter jilunii]